MEFKGSSDFEKFGNYLAGESPRGIAIVVAAYFEEKLGDLLPQSHQQNFFTRINSAFAAGLITQNESHDLQIIRNLRNSFAHKLEARDFDSNKAQQVESLKTWQIIVEVFPQYADDFPTPQDRLLYVAGAFFIRLNKRHLKQFSPLPEPDVVDTESFPIVSDR